MSARKEAVYSHFAGICPVRFCIQKLPPGLATCHRILYSITTPGASVRGARESVATPQVEIDNEVALKFALRAFRHRNYRLFFGGQGLSLVGTWMQQIAMGWLAYHLATLVDGVAPPATHPSASLNAAHACSIDLPIYFALPYSLAQEAAVLATHGALNPQISVTLAQRRSPSSMRR